MAASVARKTLPLASRSAPSFAAHLAAHGAYPLLRERVTTLQVNVGRLCNLACHHCHVEAGPKRTEILSERVAERVIDVLAASPAVTTLDLTGGAPELNPSFRFLVTEARRLGRHVIDRCNLTVLLEPGMEGMTAFLAEERVEIVASLPCYSEDNVDQQRGRGVFGRSILVLGHLNQLGYGRTPELPLGLVYNPGGAFLPPAQAALEARYRAELDERFGIEFTRLLTLTNMPIRRFADALDRSGQHEAYMSLLVQHFNPATLAGLMCRSLLSVGHDGRLYDCDFNQMLDLDLGAANGSHTIFGLDSFDALTGQPIATRSHCFGCAAGSGSSCGGALT